MLGNKEIHFVQRQTNVRIGLVMCHVCEKNKSTLTCDTCDKLLCALCCELTYYRDTPYVVCHLCCDKGLVMAMMVSNKHLDMSDSVRIRYFNLIPDNLLYGNKGTCPHCHYKFKIFSSNGPALINIHNYEGQRCPGTAKICKEVRKYILCGQ